MKRLLGTALCIGLLFVPSAQVSARHCDSTDIKRMLRSFSEAYNAGDVRRLDKLFLKRDGFWSYDVHPVERANGSDRSTLVDYFAERHSFNDVMSFRRVKAARYDNGNRGFGFNLRVTRSSDEVSPFASGEFIVKGSATCRGIYFWNMTWSRP